MAIFNAKGGTLHGTDAVTLVGEEAYFHGVLAAKGSLRVEGVVEGDVTDAVNVEIGKKGRIKGNVAAEAVSVAGVIEGDVVCTRALEILSGGRVTGNIRTPKLRIDDGAAFDGNCAMVRGEDADRRDDAESYQASERS